MSDIDLNIGVYGDASGGIAAFDGLTASQLRFNQAMSGIEAPAVRAAAGVEQFNRAASNPLQHAGVYLFSRQMLGLAGMGDLARHALMAISVGFDTVAESVGTTTAVLAPWLLAIGVGIVAYEKFGKSGNVASKEMEKARKEMDAQIKSLDSFYEAQEKVSKQGKIIAAMAMEGKEDEIRKTTQQLAEYEQKLKDSNEAIKSHSDSLARFEDHIEGVQHWFGLAGESASKFSNNTVASQEPIRTQIQVLRGELEKLQPEYEKLKELAGGTSKASVKGAEEAQKAQEAANKTYSDAVALLQKDGQSAEEAGLKFANMTGSNADKIRELNSLADNNGKSSFASKLQKEQDAVTQRYEKEISEIEKSGATADQITAHKSAIAHQYNEEIAALSRKSASEQESVLRDVQSAFGSTFQGAAHSAGSAFGQMVAFHKSFHDSFINLGKDMEAQFISMIVDMTIRFLEFKLLTAMVPGFGVPAAFPSIATGIKAASGFDGLVGQPTTFTAGEAGQVERVSISPLGSGPTGGGASSGPQNVSVNVSVQAAGVVTDINAFASHMGQKIAQSIRGGGQLSLVRTS